MKCVPFALSFLTGKPADEVLGLLQEDGGYSGRKRSTFSRTVYIPLLEKLGGKITARVVNPHMTIRRWTSVRALHGDKALWLIRMSGHVAVYRDGKLYDNQDPTGTGKSMAALSSCRLTHAWQVAA